MSNIARRVDFQFTDSRHQAETAFSGMWLFLATEAMFFGPLFLAWVYARVWGPPGFGEGARHTDVFLGTLNTALLVTSSFAYAAGLAFIEKGDSRRLVQCCVLAWMLALSFLMVKFGIEWRRDFHDGLFPGDGFAITGEFRGGAQLFFVFYFMSTGIHGLHMLVGLALVGWIILEARRGRFSAAYVTPVVVVGLYWSFVDMIWLVLYPLIYLLGRAA